ncbi:MAG: cyclic nucleotide-binding domain-containing protein [Mariniblastus sp.]
MIKTCCMNAAATPQNQRMEAESLNAFNSKIQRPQRWDEPFDPNMTSVVVAELLTVEPFKSIDPNAFSKSVPLNGVLKNDCRIIDCKKGDIIVREGDYGSSAFLVLFGEAIVAFNLPSSILGREPQKKKGWGAAIAQLWQNSKHPEAREYSGSTDQSATDSLNQSANGAVGSRVDETGTHVFLHDIPGVINVDGSIAIKEGEIFGEISALTRTQRSATVVANTAMRLIEIRWQGFRELLKRHDALRIHVEKLYRENSLRAHLREMELFKNLPKETIDQLAEVTVFESYGDFQWNQNFKSTQKKDISDRILSEPIIAQQGEYVDGLILIRNGFARLSRQHGHGHQTIAYLGKGQTFGSRELTHNWKTGEQRPWLLSLRAVGYVDVLRIPTTVIEELVLPHLPKSELPPPLPPLDPTETTPNRRLKKREESMDKGLLEFLVEKRLINGTQTMMIDLDRCTRCDDCVRACASTHDNNPRFSRSGEIHDHWMFASACMHCMDPVCMIGCPTGAIGRDQETGNVSINDNTCIGCSTCSNSCPYDNIRMVEVNNKSGLPIVDIDTGTPIVKATKCDLCADQLGGPACQRACPHDALVRIDLSTPDAITDWSKR